MKLKKLRQVRYETLRLMILTALDEGEANVATLVLDVAWSAAVIGKKDFESLAKEIPTVTTPAPKALIV